MKKYSVKKHRITHLRQHYRSTSRTIISSFMSMLIRDIYFFVYIYIYICSESTETKRKEYCSFVTEASSRLKIREDSCQIHKISMAAIVRMEF
jgi:hypothetical protein